MPMDSLFADDSDANHQPHTPRAPLAERMRPTTLDHLAGQEHLVGRGAPLRAYVDRGDLPSMLLWGPPGTGKTTLAKCEVA